MVSSKYYWENLDKSDIIILGRFPQTLLFLPFFLFLLLILFYMLVSAIWCPCVGVRLSRCRCVSYYIRFVFIAVSRHLALLLVSSVAYICFRKKRVYICVRIFFFHIVLLHFIYHLLDRWMKHSDMLESWKYTRILAVKWTEEKPLINND